MHYTKDFKSDINGMNRIVCKENVEETASMDTDRLAGRERMIQSVIDSVTGSQPCKEQLTRVLCSSKHIDMEMFNTMCQSSLNTCTFSIAGQTIFDQTSCTSSSKSKFPSKVAIIVIEVLTVISIIIGVLLAVGYIPFKRRQIETKTNEDPIEKYEVWQYLDIQLLVSSDIMSQTSISV
jgi:hypothetical protein